MGIGCYVACDVTDLTSLVAPRWITRNNPKD